MKTLELHWLAGLVEGEGSIGTRSNKRANGRPDTYIRLQLEMTDEDVVRRAHAIAGVGGVYGPYTNPRSMGTKPIWRWSVGAEREVAALSMMLYPLMGQRRQAKIREVLLFWRSK